MKVHGRQLTVSPKELARLEQAFGPQERPRTNATWLAHRKAHPEEHAESPPGFFAVHHVAEELKCQNCGRMTRLLVQTCGLTGPTSIGDVVCLPCGNLEKSLERKQKIRRHGGKKSHTRGTDLL